MPLVTSGTAPECEIADAMVAKLLTVPELQEPEIRIEAPVDIDRRVDEMKAGELLLDVWPYGIRQEKKNRRHDEYTFEVHLGVRVKMVRVTPNDVKILSYYRDLAQRAFGIRSVLNLNVNGDPLRVHLLESEPFAPYSRSRLHSDGLFIAPIRFAWKALR